MWLRQFAPAGFDGVQMNFKPSLSQLFSAFAPFRGIAAHDVADIVSHGRIHSVPKDRPVFEQGLDAIAFYLLVEGYVRVIKVQPNGEQVVLRCFPAGELIGIAPAMNLKAYPATAIAAIDCVVMAWPSRFWDEFGAKHPTFLANVLRTVGARLQASQERLIEISTKRAEQRVALALLHIGETVGRAKDGGFTIDSRSPARTSPR